MTTSFLRFMILLAKSTQHITKKLCIRSTTGFYRNLDRRKTLRQIRLNIRRNCIYREYDPPDGYSEKWQRK